MSNKTVIAFWSHELENGYLSNLYPAPFELDGVQWPTSEHYYQTMKHDDPIIIEKIRRQARAINSKIVSRRASKKLGRWPDESHKLRTMRIAIKAKFDQNQDLKTLLLSTEPLPIVEDSSKDSYWGMGSDGLGRNMMGVLLMELRALYLSEKNSTT